MVDAVTTPFSEFSTWVPQRLIDVASAGRTSPLIVECSPRTPSGSTAVETFVVKARGPAVVDDGFFFREVAGSLLASALGIDVPEPAFIDIDDAFISAIQRLPVVGNRDVKPGLCFGCRHLGRGLDVPGPGTMYDAEMRAAAARVYAFDLAVQNSDRLPGNPNCVLSGGRVIVFDHERAFEFTWRSNEPVSPIDPAKLWIARRHLFHEAAGKEKASLLSFASDLQALDINQLRDAASWMPASWHLNLKKVVNHIETIQANIDTFQNNLVGAAA